MDTRLVTGARDARSRARGASGDSPGYGNLRGEEWPWLPCPHPPQHSGAKGQHRAPSGVMAWSPDVQTEEANRSCAQVPARTVSPIAGPTYTADQKAEQRGWGLQNPQGEHLQMENVAQRKNKTGL